MTSWPPPARGEPKVVPTLRGVGIADATSTLQIDRYSAVSTEGAVVSFLNNADRREGWMVALDGKGAWARFDGVDFRTGTVKAVHARSQSLTGGRLEIHLDAVDGPLLAKVTIGKGSGWTVVKSKLKHVPAGVHNLVVALQGDGRVELDWISFK